MPDSLGPLQSLALKYASMQHEAAELAQQDPGSLRRHIRQTLCRCLPEAAITEDFVSRCFEAVRDLDAVHDPMHTGAIHAFAGELLLSADSADPLTVRLQDAARRLLPVSLPATRDDLRLVTLDALHAPGLLPDGEASAFVRQRLGLRDGIPRSCEEIAAAMHKPLTYIHELETAVLATLSLHHTGGRHA